jgi:cardiolipin synthase
MVHKRFAQAAAAMVPFVLAFVVACPSQPETESFRMLPARFADEQFTEPLEALEMLRDEDEFYLRYRMGDEILFAGGRWSDRIDLDAIAHGEDQTGPFIMPLKNYGPDHWPGNVDGLISTRILSAADWQSFRDGFFASVLPRDEKAGVVLHFQTDNYFLFSDENGRFQSTLFIDKPPDYAVSAVTDFPQLVERGIPLLDRFLADRGVFERRVLFNTDDTGAYSLPFLYVNLDLPVVVFGRREPTGRPYETAPAVPLMQTAGHLTRSHSSALLLRPFSSVYRLLFVASGAVAETARPDWLVTLESTEIPPINDGPGMDIEAWESQLTSLTGRKPTRGEIEYLVDGDAFFTQLIEGINAAESSIDLRTYIFDNDDYAERIGRLLKRRSKEGVEIRLLFDGIGTIFSTFEHQETLPEDWKGASSVHAFLEADSEIDVRQSPNPWMTGDHVKTIIIDGKYAFTGGMNIAREYRYDWHDVMMEVRGPVVDTLQHEFNKAWAYAGFLGDYAYFFRRIMPKPGDADVVGYPIRVLYTRVDDHEIFRVQREAIRNARQRIFVENAYFTDDVMLYELVKARRRGVDVRVIMPLVTDRGPITRNNALAANVMLEHGIRVYVYPGMSHVKAAVFDDWVCLGSANWDKWSLAINKELNLATSHPDAVQGLVDEVFEPDFLISPELNEPFPERWSDYLLEFMGDYMF